MPRREEAIDRDMRGGSLPRGVDARIGWWTTPRQGVCTRRALTQVLLLSPDQVDRRLASGRLRATRYDGVFVWGHGARVPGQREAIAYAACGPGAVMAAESIAALRGQISRYRGDVTIAVPRGRNHPLPGIRKLQLELLPTDFTSFGPFRATSPERTVLDLPPEHLREGFQWLMRNGIEIEPLVERMRGRRRAVAFRREASLLVPQLAMTASELEARFVLLCDRIGADLPVVNGSLQDGDLLDCTWPGRRLVVELDGRTWHEAHFDADRARDRRRTLEGKLPMRFGWIDVVEHADRTGREVLRGLSLG